MKLGALKELLNLPGADWKDISPPSNEYICVGKTSKVSKISHSVTIKGDGSWDVCIYGQTIHPEHSPILSPIPLKIESKSASRLLELVNSSTICCGNNDKKFVSMIAGRKDISSDGSVAAFLDTSKDVCMVR